MTEIYAPDTAFNQTPQAPARIGDAMNRPNVASVENSRSIAAECEFHFCQLKCAGC
jgi:hypothetical protein